MCRRFRPAVEALESYRLLSGVAAVVTAPMTAPVLVAPSVTYTLTTDHTTYKVGQPVRITLTEKNTSNHDVMISFGPSIDGFFVTRNGATVWRSNAGIQPMFIGLFDLEPGQSFTRTATWDGHPNNPLGVSSTATPTGTFQVHSAHPAAPVTITITP